MRDDLLAWFEREGLLRVGVVCDPAGEVVERVCPPVVALGARDDQFVYAPHPDESGYLWLPLREMTLDDYNDALFRWFEAAVAVGDVACAQCGRRLAAGDDLPDPETWDAILIEKELVAWMAVHFDCKRWLAKKLKGMTPFDLHPTDPPHYDLAQVPAPPPRTAAPLDDAPSEDVAGQPTGGDRGEG